MPITVSRVQGVIGKLPHLKPNGVSEAAKKCKQCIIILGKDSKTGKRRALPMSINTDVFEQGKTKDKMYCGTHCGSSYSPCTSSYSIPNDPCWATAYM